MLHVTIVCLVSFLVAMWTVSQGIIIRDDLEIQSSVSIVVKKIKIIYLIFQKAHHAELLKHFRCYVRCVWKRTVFLSERQRFFLKRISLFSPKKRHCKTLCPCTYVLQRWTAFLLLPNVVQDPQRFFSLLNSHSRLRFCSVMLLHMAQIWAGGFACCSCISYILQN